MPYEPWVHEELRQAGYDRRCAEFDHCDLCGQSLYPFDTYIELEGKKYCEDCITRNTHHTSDLEMN